MTRRTPPESYAFESTPPRGAALRPRVTGRTEQPGGVSLSLEVPAGLDWFDGHFPGEPILPGVAQVGWAIAYAREQFGLDRDPQRIDRVKFLRTAGPGARLALELTRDGGHVSWRLREGDKLLSRGRLTFETA